MAIPTLIDNYEKINTPASSMVEIKPGSRLYKSELRKHSVYQNEEFYFKKEKQKRDEARQKDLDIIDAIKKLEDQISELKPTAKFEFEQRLTKMQEIDSKYIDNLINKINKLDKVSPDITAAEDAFKELKVYLEEYFLMQRDVAIYMHEQILEITDRFIVKKHLLDTLENRIKNENLESLYTILHLKAIWLNRFENLKVLVKKEIKSIAEILNDNNKTKEEKDELTSKYTPYMQLIRKKYNRSRKSIYEIINKIDEILITSLNGLSERMNNQNNLKSMSKAEFEERKIEVEEMKAALNAEVNLLVKES